MNTPATRTIGLRLAIVLSHATQYYSPWFRWLTEKTNLSVKVFYLSAFGVMPAQDEKFGQSFAWDVDLTTGYDWEIVPNTAVEPDTLCFNGLRNPGLHAALRAWGPEAILLFGYNYNTHLKLIVWARLQRIPLIFRGDSHLLGRDYVRSLKRIPLALLYRQFTSIVYVGEANLHYFRYLGVPQKKLFFAPHAVNATLYSPENPQHLEDAATLRTKLKLAASTRVVLFAGKLIPSKQPLALLENFIQLAPRDTALVFVGDGEEKNILQARAAARADIRVHFLPFANQSEMPVRYLLADIFVLPSLSHYETWGLSINEAMHMGIPCLVSDLVGCQRDLVTDGETGWVFKAGNNQHMRTKLRAALATLQRDRQVLRTAVLKRIANYSYEETTAGLISALHSITEHKFNKST